MSLDPKTNRLNREAAQAEANIPPPLDPEFPFQPTAFDPWFFGIEQMPEPTPAQTAESSPSAQ